MTHFNKTQRTSYCFYPFSFHSVRRNRQRIKNESRQTHTKTKKKKNKSRKTDVRLFIFCTFSGSWARESTLTKHKPKNIWPDIQKLPASNTYLNQFSKCQNVSVWILCFICARNQTTTTTKRKRNVIMFVESQTLRHMSTKHLYPSDRRRTQFIF